MAKRQSDEVVPLADAAKRQKTAHAAITTDQLALLDRFSKELRAFVKASKKDKKGKDDKDKDAQDGDVLPEDAFAQLAELSSSVLPIFQTPGASSSLTSSLTSQPPRSLPPTAAAAKIPTPSTPITPSHAHVSPLSQNLARWTPADIPSGRAYPPLPPIPDPALAQMAMTHRGMLGCGNAAEAASYETLEYVGDAFIYHVAAELITQTFPRRTLGQRSQMREGILRNENLAKYTVHYGLDKHAQIPDEFVGDGRDKGSRATDHGRQKVNGDLFEAYVGALVRAQSAEPGYDGLAVTVRWLRSLWAMTLANEIEGEARRLAALQAATESADGSAPAAPLPPAKVRLSAAIVCRGVEIRYEDVRTAKPKYDKFTKMPLFTVKATFVGWGTTTELGLGTALSKREAGEKAAERALENGKLMKELKGKKAEHLARIAAEAKAKEEAEAEAKEAE